MAGPDVVRPSGTRRSPKGAARRRRIIDAALELYSQKGYQSTSLADIATAADISQAGLLHHFPSKQDVLLAALHERDAESVRILQLHSKEGIDFLNSYLKGIRRSDQKPMLYLLSAIISAEAVPQTHPAHEYFVRLYDERLQTMERAVGQAFDLDALPAGVTAESVARWIVAMADGLRYQMAYSADFKDRAAIMVQFLEALRPYLRVYRPFDADPEESRDPDGEEVVSTS